VAPRFQQRATLEAVLVSICAEARRSFGCDVVQIWTPVDDEQLEAAWRDPPSDVIPPGLRVDFDFPGLIEEMWLFDRCLCERPGEDAAKRCGTPSGWGLLRSASRS
jgi:hypothetical protein